MLNFHLTTTWSKYLGILSYADIWMPEVPYMGYLHKVQFSWMVHFYLLVLAEIFTNSKFRIMSLCNQHFAKIYLDLVVRVTQLGYCVHAHSRFSLSINRVSVHNCTGPCSKFKASPLFACYLELTSYPRHWLIHYLCPNSSMCA